MVSLPHLANDLHDQKHQVFKSAPMAINGGVFGVGPDVNRRVTLPPGHLGSNKILTVFLVAILPVLCLAIYATVLDNLALLALLQDGRVGLHPVVSNAVDTFIYQVGRRGDAGRHLQ